MTMDSRLNDEALVGNSNPLVYMVQNEEIGATSVAYCDQINRSSYSNLIDNRVLSSESDVFQYQLDGAVTELEPKFTEFGSGSVLKRKRFDDAYQLTPSQSVDIEHERNEISDYANEDNLSQKSVSKSCCKIVGKECVHKSFSKKASSSVIHSTNSTEDGNKDYVQVRAKRGEATSRHSLAERIRRERISERMKVLQDLVPGCNKITGKAIMLDEIINYVLSLQHQVEFLSMKLATVDPRQKSGVDQFVLEDIHHSQGGNAANVDNLELGFYSLPDHVSQMPLPALVPIPNVILFEPQMFINHKQCSDSNNLLLVSNSKSMERDEPRKEPNGFRL